MTSELDAGPGTDISAQINSAAAALAAAGVGCLAMGVVTTLSEAMKPIANLLNLYKPVGPLSGKSLTAVVVWLLAWAAMGTLAKSKQISASRWIAAAFVCTAIGVVMTCPLFFDLFGG